jgi:putative transcription antitermination factor YqgF
MIFTSVSEFLKANQPLKGELLSVDLGAKKTGIAFSVLERKSCVPWEVIYEASQEKLLIEIKKMMKEKNCNFVILGFPFAWEEGLSAKRIMNFAKLLAKHEIQVLLYDENSTSIKVREIIYESKGKMKKSEKQSYDAQVAALILSNAIDDIISNL